MVKEGQIPAYAFRAPHAVVAGLEILDVAELRQRALAGLHPVHRVDFHNLALITGGTGDHMVDFVPHHCRAGTLLWCRPGQVQRFDPGSSATGPQLLFTGDFPPPFSSASRLLADWHGPVSWQLDPDDPLRGLLTQMTIEYARPSREILQLLLAAVLLHIDRLPHPGGGSPQAGGEAYARFQAELERSYATTRRAEDYAARLGYSVKTLTRACLAATGRPVKHVIDARVVLQAQRLLAHTDDPVASIARHLGFTEPTNFGKFFTRNTGSTPGDFRDAVRT